MRLFLILLNILITITVLASEKRAFALTPDQEKAEKSLLAVLQNPQNKLVYSALALRVKELKEKIPVTYESLRLLAEYQDPLNFFPKKYIPVKLADPSRFWKVISAWISMEPFRVDFAPYAFQLAKLAAEPTLIEGHAIFPEGRGLTHTYRLLTPKFQKENSYELRGVNLDLLIDVLPILLPLAVHPTYRLNFFYFILAIDKFSSQSDWDAGKFLKGLNATLEIINYTYVKSDPWPVVKSMDLLTKSAPEALRKNSMQDWSDKVVELARFERNVRLQRCRETLNLSLPLFN